MKNAARFITLQNPVQFIKDFGLEDDWKDMTLGDFIKSDIPDLTIDNFDNAIRIVKHSNIKNVQLRQDDKINGGTIEWDNF
jgi:hypothetical protein